MKNKNLYNILKLWLPFAITSTVCIMFVYVAIQQNLRLSANDPQIQISEDASDYFKNGGQINNPENKLEMSHSLSPYYMVFDSKKKLIASSGVLNGKTPIVPSGVFDYAKYKDQNRFTWQPEVGVRIAAVLTYFNGKNQGYVLAGRSLREVEKRIDVLNIFAVGALLASLLLSLVVILFFELNLIKKIKIKL